jgi:hypothetical protein
MGLANKVQFHLNSSITKLCQQKTNCWQQHIHDNVHILQNNSAFHRYVLWYFAAETDSGKKLGHTAIYIQKVKVRTFHTETNFKILVKLLFTSKACTRFRFSLIQSPDQDAYPVTNKYNLNTKDQFLKLLYRWKSYSWHTYITMKWKVLGRRSILCH